MRWRTDTKMEEEEETQDDVGGENKWITGGTGWTDMDGSQRKMQMSVCGRVVEECRKGGSTFCCFSFLQWLKWPAVDTPYSTAAPQSCCCCWCSSSAMTPNSAHNHSITHLFHFSQYFFLGHICCSCAADWFFLPEGREHSLQKALRGGPRLWGEATMSSLYHADCFL